MQKTIILGAGISGLAAGIKTGFSIYEAKSYPGGLCYSYQSGKAFFEYSGGHWIFGHDKKLFNYLNNLSPLNWHKKDCAVFFPKEKLFVPYPLQKNLSFLPLELQKKINQGKKNNKIDLKTMDQWLLANFGPELCKIFFFPFHQNYTAGLYQKISPAEKFKTPNRQTKSYNDCFAYPKKGLSHLLKQMAKQCRILYNKKVIKIDLKEKLVFFEDGEKVNYQKIISTLPLNKMLELTGLKVKEKPDPYTSLLVVNILASKGLSYPKQHWLYLPESKSGFHRAGFYTNIDRFFKPKNSKNQVSLYVEKAYLGGKILSLSEQKKAQENIVKELIEWQFINKPEIVYSNFIEVAYTWEWPNSTWKSKALAQLKKNNIIQIGRYGRWHFQGILESIKEGFNLKS